jgi:hypothetical protein
MSVSHEVDMIIALLEEKQVLPRSADKVQTDQYLLKEAFSLSARNDG